MLADQANHVGERLLIRIVALAAITGFLGAGAVSTQIGFQPNNMDDGGPWFAAFINVAALLCALPFVRALVLRRWACAMSVYSLAFGEFIAFTLVFDSRGGIAAAICYCVLIVALDVAYAAALVRVWPSLRRGI
jgi:hypothetical protein